MPKKPTAMARIARTMIDTGGLLGVPYPDGTMRLIPINIRKQAIIDRLLGGPEWTLGYPDTFAAADALTIMARARSLGLKAAIVPRTPEQMEEAARLRTRQAEHHKPVFPPGRPLSRAEKDAIWKKTLAGMHERWERGASSG